MLTVITGDHIRHLYLINYLSHHFEVDNWIIQKRENQKKSAVIKFSKLQKLEKIHFEKRLISEEKFFGSKKDFNIKANKIFKINKSNLTDGKLTKILKKNNCQNLITYGCHKISTESLKVVKKNAWNIHAGLSPWYRGSMTHFWPTYMLEPEFTGVTVHKITNNIDGGEIIHQSLVNLNPNDGIHDNACRCMKNFIKDFVTIIPKNFNNKKFIGVKQTTSGRIWTSKMWHPNLLKVIYEKFNDKINKFCLENKKIEIPIVKSILAK